jgi:hypothetical protein
VCSPPITSGTGRTKTGTVAATTNYLSHLGLTLKWVAEQDTEAQLPTGQVSMGLWKSAQKQKDHKYARKIKIIKIIHKSAHQPDLRLSHRASNFPDRSPPPLLNPQNSSMCHSWRRGCCWSGPLPPYVLTSGSYDLSSIKKIYLLHSYWMVRTKNPNSLVFFYPGFVWVGVSEGKGGGQIILNYYSCFGPCFLYIAGLPESFWKFQSNYFSG